MFKMPFISETPSTANSRSGFHDALESARATPSFAKSVSRENLLHSSTVRNFNDRDEFRDAAPPNNGLPVRSFDLPEDPSFWKDHNVQVIIRLRPLNNSEMSLQGYNRCVRQESCQTITWTGHPESRFTFDLVADENVTQEKLFKVAGVPMVENCVGGYNSCMFAYGQTGSGKTHTMLGDIEGGTRRHSVNCGMTPRVFEYLFSRIQKEKETRREEKMRFTCKCSFLEIYNEQILDLLNPSSVNLQMREDLKKGVYVENLTEVEVTSAREVMQQLLEGAANRKVAATNMNRASSRSHSVFTCVLESTWESQGVTHHRFARLNLVDLAGSERQKSSGAEGERLKEATNINKSLSTLGLVIMNLVSISNGKSLHVPYRDSKLTFLLQDSLGGNSKTIIIANISPSTCSSLETLSTLKFAQRAKFIKNNAIVNEDASGDVLAMRMQIQQLKKEVSHLRGLLNGGVGIQDTDHMSVGLLESPGAFKWEGLNGTFSPLTSDKRMSQKKEYEVALVGAFRREKDKDMALQALAAENQAAIKLAKQREDEIQGLKMRLRFREAGIKRLEAVASGKISAEAHLLKEKEEHLKEIEVLRAQVDRNQEVTRFAMENLRLKEEIRRLKAIYEEGEMERMNEQIVTLQSKLLEALDWKLMHETGPSDVQKSPDPLADNHMDDLLHPDKESASHWQSSIKEENEFLRLQAIQNQAEIDSLRKKLDSCIEEKATLERHIKDLETELAGVRASRDSIEETRNLQINVPSTAANDINKMSFSDQLELKAMVDAIAAASQREAEAHEMAITLAKENDELRAKFKVLIDDNKKLIDLYERAVAETSNKVIDIKAEDGNNAAQNTGSDAASDNKDPELKKKLEDLEQQLKEMHEENEKLISLYERAMEEKTARYDAASDEKKKLEDLEHQLKEMHEENEKLLSLYERAMEEKTKYDAASDEKKKLEDLEHQLKEMHEGYEKLMTQYESAMQEKTTRSDAATDKKDPELKKLEDLEHQLTEMHEENDKLMSLYEKATKERNDFKKMLSSAQQNKIDDKGGLECPEKLVEVDAGNHSRSCDFIVDRSMSMEIDVPTLSAKAEALEKNVTVEWDMQDSCGQCPLSTLAAGETAVQSFVEASSTMDGHQISAETEALEKDVGSDEHQNFVEANSTMVIGAGCNSSTVNEERNTVEMDNLDGPCQSPCNFEDNPDVNVRAYSEAVIEEKLVLVRRELDKARERLSNSSRTVSEFGALEKAILEVDELSRDIEVTKKLMQLKEQEFESIKLLSNDIQESKALIGNKLAALKVSLSSFSSSITYFEQREVRARTRAEVSRASLEQKKVDLAHLQFQSDALNARKREIQEAELELRNNHLCLKSKLEEENRRQENERVLFDIDNVEKAENPTIQNSWKLGSKATELLKSEEEKIKLQNEITQSREKIGAMKKEIEELNRKCRKLDYEIKAVSLEKEKASKIVEETELALENIIHEKEVLLETSENGETEISGLIFEWQLCLFEESIREEELKILGEDIHTTSAKLEKFKTQRAASMKRATDLLDGKGNQTGLRSEKMQQELVGVWSSIVEAESLLCRENLTYSQAILSVRPCEFTCAPKC